MKGGSMVTGRSQPPVPPEDRPPKPERISQSWLTIYGRCKRSALLDLQFDHGAESPEMEGGSLAHEVFHRLTLEAIENGMPEVPPEVAMAALFEVYAEGEHTVPPERWDHIRRCVFNWSTHTKFPLDEILGVEQLVVMDLAGWRVSGKLDLCKRNGNRVTVEDYKTSLAAKTKEQFEHSLQVAVVYPLLLAFGSPVEVAADGTETVKDYPLGHGAEFFEVAEVYPALAFEDGSGLMERRRTVSRSELLNERSMLEALLAQVTHSFETGEWPAVPSDEACGKCPARRACPLPDQLLPFTAIESQEEAEHFALAMSLLDVEKKEVVKALKAWVKNKDGSPRPVDLGNGTRLNFVKQEVNETDYAGFTEAQSQGKVVDLESFRSKRAQTSFKPEPIPEEAETADQRFGAEAPW